MASWLRLRTKSQKIKSRMDKIQNWTKSRIGKNPELDKIQNGQNPELDKIPNWTKSKKFGTS